MAIKDVEKIQGIHYQTGKPTEIVVDQGSILSVKEIAKENLKADHIIAPGFIDIQINGYKGFDFNDRPLNDREWTTVTKHLLDVGVTCFYPTVITNSIEELANIFESNSRVINDNHFLKTVIKGFHLEGPYLSPEDGPRGAHEKKFIKAPDWDEFCYLQEKAKGKIKIITLSPEWKNANEFIDKATKSGVKVAIGHTSANSNQIKSAVKAGAVLSTHLGNGAHVKLARHPNYIWDQLAEDKLWASVIADGHHLPVNVLHVFNKVKANQMILVSDSVALAGMEPGNYYTPVGGEVTLTESGRLHLKNEPNLLAGSVQNILQGVNNLVENKITSLSDAIDKASILPAKFMGLKQQEGFQIGATADILALDVRRSDWEIVNIWKEGKKMK